MAMKILVGIQLLFHVISMGCKFSAITKFFTGLLAVIEVIVLCYPFSAALPYLIAFYICNSLYVIMTLMPIVNNVNAINMLLEKNKRVDVSEEKSIINYCFVFIFICICVLMASFI